MKKLSMLVLGLFAVQFAIALPVYAEKTEQELIAEKRTELNDHEWAVKISSAANKEDVTEDSLIFKDQMFETANMAKEGYKPTNYTVSLQEGGPTVWETMQSSEDGKVVFWRGEWEGESMRGVISKQLGEGKTENYYFSSVSSKAIEKAPEPVAEEIAAEVVEEAVDATAAVTDELADMDEASVMDEITEEVPAAEEVIAEAPKAVEEVAIPEPVQEAPKKKKKWGF